MQKTYAVFDCDGQHPSTDVLRAALDEITRLDRPDPDELVSQIGADEDAPFVIHLWIAAAFDLLLDVIADELGEPDTIPATSIEPVTQAELSLS